MVLGTFSLACSHVINVPLDDLSRLAKYHEQEEILISNGEEEVLVTAEDDPEVRLHHNCGFWALFWRNCHPLMSAPLKSLRFNGTNYHFEFQPNRTDGQNCLGIRSISENSTLAEFNVVHSRDELEDDEFPTDQDGEWILWGGGGIVYLFGDQGRRTRIISAPLPRGSARDRRSWPWRDPEAAG